MLCQVIYRVHALNMKAHIQLDHDDERVDSARDVEQFFFVYIICKQNFHSR